MNFSNFFSSPIPYSRLFSMLFSKQRCKQTNSCSCQWTRSCTRDKRLQRCQMVLDEIHVSLRCLAHLANAMRFITLRSFFPSDLTCYFLKTPKCTRNVMRIANLPMSGNDNYLFSFVHGVCNIWNFSSWCAAFHEYTFCSCHSTCQSSDEVMIFTYSSWLISQPTMSWCR